MSISITMYWFLILFRYFQDALPTQFSSLWGKTRDDILAALFLYIGIYSAEVFERSVHNRCSCNNGTCLVARYTTLSSCLRVGRAVFLPLHANDTNFCTHASDGRGRKTQRNQTWKWKAQKLQSCKTISFLAEGEYNNRRQRRPRRIRVQWGQDAEETDVTYYCNKKKGWNEQLIRSQDRYDK